MNSTITKQELLESLPRKVSELLDFDNQDFYTWQAENTDSGGYSHNSDKRDRYNRCYEAAENGCDGSTHSENIQDFRDYCDQVYSELRRAANRLDLTDTETDEVDAAIDEAQTACEADIDACEAWHEKNGSLNQQIG